VKISNLNSHQAIDQRSRIDGTIFATFFRMTRLLHSLVFVLIIGYGPSSFAQTEGKDLKLPAVSTFQLHMPLIINNDELRKAVITNCHEGGIAVYINVEKYPLYSSNRAFFSNGIQTYAMTKTDLFFHEINTYLMIDSIGHQTDETTYLVTTFNKDKSGMRLKVDINNDTPSDTGPILKEFKRLD